MKRILSWLDHRTGLKNLMHEALYERIPGGARWRYVWGSTLVFAFAVQMITGIFLWMAYSPSAQTAWESVYFIQEHMTLGWLVRGMHHYAAQAMVVLLAFHLIQVIIDGAYRAPREVNFWLGLVLMQIVLGLSLTGYLLPWDQKGYYATQVATKIMGATPLVGPQLQTLVQGGPEYGHHTLTRFFAMHAGILPGLLVLFVILHIAVFRRHGIHPKNVDRAPTTTFFPDQVLKDGVACLGVLAVVMLLAVYKGAELSAPANPAESYSAARPEWYFLFLFQFLRFEWVENVTKGPRFGAIYVPGILMLIVLLMPITGRWKAGHRFNVAFVWVMVLAIAGLTTLSFVTDANDEGFQVAVEEAERDAQRVKELAQGPNRIPVQGAASLLKSDPFTQGPRLFAKHCASCHRYNGHDGTGRLVYEQIKGKDGKPIEGDDGKPKQFVVRPTAADLGNLGSRAWFRSLLLDYKHHFADVKSTTWYRTYADARKQHAKTAEQWKKAKSALGKGKPNPRQKGQLQAISAALIELSKRIRGDALGQRLHRLQGDRRQLTNELAGIRAAQSALLKQLSADAAVDKSLQQSLANKLAEKKKTLAAKDAEIKTLQNEMKSPGLFGKPSGDPAVVEKQNALIGEWLGTLFDPDKSEMAAWYGDEAAWKTLKSDGNKASLENLIEFLVHENGRKDLSPDEAKAKKGQAMFQTGKLASGSVSACTDCHASWKETGNFTPSSRDFSYPDITRVYSAKWLKSFISNPARTQFYGVKNRMPPYAERLNERELDLLVRWLVRDYFPTEIPDHESKLEALKEGLKARPDATANP
jgi:quinol-cytochrome oxidoreductase complex cytochrome b subunit/mono/diheme cytochrome c family protein